LRDDGYDVDLVGTLLDDSAEIDDQDHEGHTAYTFERTRDEIEGPTVTTVLTVPAGL